MLNKIETKDIIQDYNRIYLSSGLRTNKSYYRWIIRLLRLRPSAAILDVSCGEGILLREADRLNRGIGVYGLDISNIAVSIAKKNCPKAKILAADGQRIPFKNSLFDFVICMGSLEHYLDPELGLKELSRVAKKDARFCIVLPNSYSIDAFLEILKTGNPPAEDFQIIERAAAKNEWIKSLNKNGFEVNAVYGSNLWPELFQEGTFRVKSFSKYFKRLLIKHFCPLNLAREFVFICQKARR